MDKNINKFIKFLEELKKIFEIKTEEDFEEACLSIFNYQYENIDIYHQFVDYLNINPKKILFLVLFFYQNHNIIIKKSLRRKKCQ